MNPKLRAVADRHGGVFSRAQALASGYTQQQIHHRIRDGRWRRIRHGQFAEPVDRSALQPWERQVAEHREAVHAVLNTIEPGSAVVSHQSALVLHGIDTYGLELTDVHLTRRVRRRARSIAAVHHHVARLETADLAQVAGLPVTTPSRAAFETACTTTLEPAVVAFDAVLRAGHLPEAEVRRLLTTTEFWPGSPTARAAIAFADGRSESVGESRLRVLMADMGLPEPDLQTEFDDENGLFARVDFYFAQYRTVVEFDGRMKYGDQPAEVIMAEKAREDRLRDLGLEVVRVTWADLANPKLVATRILRAFARHAEAHAVRI